MATSAARPSIGSGDLDAVKPVGHVYVYVSDEDEDMAAAVAGLRSAIAEQQRLQPGKRERP
ncbi:hypothetical protein GCM10009802_05050 [Streptomyces synnematoformans]|uniref:Uncharacterized protein n=2 Tax=Streptomyces synnematoformans TaxID=415721 RepID=A0ABN2XD69_9ACTN